MKTSLRNNHKTLRPGSPPEIRRLLADWEKLLPVRIAELSVVFLDDAAMAALHAQAANDPASTDILTFDYGEGQAEIFISLDTAKRQAREHETSFEDEVLLYLAHGLLHLSGYDDHSPADIRKMRAAEQRLLARRPISRP